jgi:hypothetical protein
VAKTGQTHTIVEDFTLPAAVGMAGTMLGEKAKKYYTDNTFIKQHSDSVMAGDVLKQLLVCIQAK